MIWNILIWVNTVVTVGLMFIVRYINKINNIERKTLTNENIILNNELIHAKEKIEVLDNIISDLKRKWISNIHTITDLLNSEDLIVSDMKFEFEDPIHTLKAIFTFKRNNGIPNISVLCKNTCAEKTAVLNIYAYQHHSADSTLTIDEVQKICHVLNIFNTCKNVIADVHINKYQDDFKNESESFLCDYFNINKISIIEK